MQLTGLTTRCMPSRTQKLTGLQVVGRYGASAFPEAGFNPAANGHKLTSSDILVKVGKLGQRSCSRAAYAA